MRMETMRAAGVQHHIHQAYRESGILQWVRETYKNAEEAHATRVHFGIEWQAVESKGVYRRVIADDGQGMTADEVKGFFNTYGGGGKPIGAEHENFGIGSKTSLLPWNPYGVVVVSWFDGDASMIWLRRDPDTGEYGLVYEEVGDEGGDTSLEIVYGPYRDDEHGCDWSQVGPPWVREGGHGTVIVLLGENAEDETVLGDPTRREPKKSAVGANQDESNIKAISSYLNRRVWEMSDLTVTVDELRTNDRSGWPVSEETAYSTAKGKHRRVNVRTLQGARHYIDYPVQGKAGVAAKDTVVLQDGTKIHWFLWSGDRPSVHTYAAETGYVSVLYRNELYRVTMHHITYRLFGVTEGEVRRNLWLVVEPPLSDELAEGKISVYPRNDRNDLLLRYGASAGHELPVNEWAAEFADRMPEQIRVALKACSKYEEGSISDSEWKKRLEDRFGNLWKILKLRLAKKGREQSEPTQPGSTLRRKKKASRKRRRMPPGGSGGGKGDENTGDSGGDKPAAKKRVGGGIPHYKPVGNDSTVSEGCIAAWVTNDAEHPEGVVYLNVEHPMIEAEIDEWVRRYAPHQSDDVRAAVIQVYGELLVAKVAHSEEMRRIVGGQRVDDGLRSDEALTMAALGLMGAHGILGPRLGAKFTKVKVS